VHDLHIWAISTTETALTVHLVIPGAPANDEVYKTITETLHHRFKIQHATVQIEKDKMIFVCGQKGTV